ncbi:hypothetical protein PC120_g19579 [Phytophthora cactorum]|nr:hypothetical protein PC120_g19579 [Phytophthora cactorum]
MSAAGGLSTLDEEVTDTSLPTTSVSSHARSAKYWRVQRVHSTTMLAAGLNGTRPSYYKRMHHQLLPAA